MPSTSAPKNSDTASAEKRSLFVLADGRNVMFTFILVSSLFLLWGVCNGLIDTMDKHFQQELHLTLSQSAWVQFAHYLGYFLMSIPAGWLATKLGYKGGIIAGLLMVAMGGFWFIPATQIAQFWAFLLGVCLIASGLTFLETIANPYTTVLGDQHYAATRINLAQSANGVGWICGPIIGSVYFYSKDAASGASTGSQTLYIPYMAIAIVVVVLAVVFWFAKVPDIKSEDDYHLDDATPGVARSIWTHPHFVMAVAAQFLYVAAQAGIFSFFINCMTPNARTGFCMVPPIPEAFDTGLKSIAAHLPDWRLLQNWLSGWFEIQEGVRRISDAGGSALQSLGFVCFLIGRVFGSWLLKKQPAHTVLGLFGILNIVVCFLIFLNLGWVSTACVFLSFFFMSIMFPTIFALGIFGLGARAKKASAYIVMAIMGGAILPKLMGYVADQYDMARGFIVPIACFAFVAFYGFYWPKFSNAESLQSTGPVRGH
jgi:MFS transporter, FHS family, L-fucose permease